MQFDFGADVRQRDGNKLGDLDGLVYDPSTRQITFLVVAHGFADRLSRVPIGSLDRSEGDQIYLELNLQQFDEMPDFETQQNIAPPPTGQDSEALDVPDVPAVGAATGVESIAFTPIIQETTDAPARDVVLDRHTEVWATDDMLGHLGGTSVDDQTERLSELIVPEGLIFTHRVIVPSDRIADIEPGRVVLNVDRHSVESANDR
ncbi:MAG: hypothetical protein ACRDFS_04815 [Chloroflexota bacterium]